MTNLEQQLGPADPADVPVLPLRVEMRVGFSSIRTEMAEQGKTLCEVEKQGEALGGRIDALSTQMRVLHEDVIGRIALLREDRPKRPNGKRW
ncbi:MAG: hypothetical protein M3Q55_01765 [Acidobacteriota bacterium]|nr:hypothetical protein [Acidobacteriota bacterium]